MRRLFLALTILILSPSLFAKETDNLTGRYKPLEDSTEILDKEMNKRLQELITEANDDEIKCSDTQKIRILFHDLNPGKNFIGAMETWSEESDKVSKRKGPFKNSIYNGVLDPTFEKVGIASTIKVNGQLIGTDKLGHFIDQGFTYYTSFRKGSIKDGMHAGMQAALTGSIGSEGSLFGSKSTGTKSYADSMANYQGIMFYHSLTEGASPYLKCVDGKWSQINSFTFASYVDGGWDEGINCNEIDTAKKAAYEANIQKLEADSKTRGREDNFRCPVDLKTCGRLHYRHVTYDKYVLSPECRKVPIDRSSPSDSDSGSPTKGKVIK
jgi:hypothetical protein